MMMQEVDVPPNRCTTVVYYAWKIFTCLFLHVLLVNLVVSYCLAGAFMFSRLEGENEKSVRKNVFNIRNDVMERLWTMTQESDVLRQQNWTMQAKKSIEEFEESLVRTMRRDGWNGADDEDDLQWTFSGALFYSIIVITTIGYGHIAPKTTWGKVGTIFYAIVGIPLMLLCLSNIGDIMAHSFRFIYWKVCCYACTRPRKPPEFTRRQKSIRSYDGRMPTRSLSARPASFRRQVRTSTRSADYALSMADAMNGRGAHSDTECGYYDEMERDYQMRGARGMRSNRASHWSREPPPLRTGRRHQSRLAEHSRSNQNLRYNGVPHDLSPGRGRSDYNRQKYQRSSSYPRHAPEVNSTQAQNYRNRMRRGKSAIPEASERDVELGTGRRTRTLPTRNHLSVDMSPPPIVHRARTRQKGGARSRLDLEPQSPHHTPSPRIMSPLGFAVHRQTYIKPRPPPPPPPIELDYYPPDFDFFTEYYDTKASGSEQIKPVPIWLCVFLVISYIIGGAFLFSNWEPWTLPDSAYFCFITLTTIGFGDFVPAQKIPKPDNPKTAEVAAEMRIALCSLYLLFGIALLAMSFNLVQEEVISNVKAVARHLGIIKSSNEYEDE
uniref:TWiK family of potassium channels protein 18 n=1 Tax=Cacopsylla melanoneura TaxID=428564 RepID=A0A8D9BKU8_9HEMI